MSKKKFDRGKYIEYLKKVVISHEATIEKYTKELAILEKKPNRHLYTELFEEVASLRHHIDLTEIQLNEVKELITKLESQESEQKNNQEK